MFDVNYGTYHELMDEEIRERLKTRHHPLGNNNAYPFVILDPEKGNYEQITAKKRFNDLINKYHKIKYTDRMIPEHFIKYAKQNIAMQCMQAVMTACAMEANHIPELEQLAVDIVKKDFNIKDGEIIFDAKITGLNSAKPPKSDTYGDPEIEEFEFPEDISDEIQKRQFINALMSGASKKGHYIFHLAKEKLDKIHPKLIDEYQLSMVGNDLSYYMIGDNMVKMLLDSDEDFHAGHEKISFNEDGVPVITAVGVYFPALLHELIKGVIELLATVALPDDKNILEKVYDEADSQFYEVWYLRLGPIYWEKLMVCFPPEYAQYKSLILGKLFALETEDFNEFMQIVLSFDENDNQLAKDKLLTMAKNIERNIQSYSQKDY